MNGLGTVAIKQDNEALATDGGESKVRKKKYFWRPEEVKVKIIPFEE